MIDEILKKTSLQAAPLLLGCILAKNTSEGIIKLKIVETEAYHQDDPASHSYRGQTIRTAPMFQVGGRLYIYFTYGMHYCINIVTGPKEVGEAVLIRAAEPLTGIKIMQKNRGLIDLKKLANGPGKLSKALGITDTSLSGKILNKSSILLEPPQEKIQAKNIVASPRIGITQAADTPWRFYLKDNMFVSRPAA